jgi:Domain of unknown function (DUF4136)
MIACLSLYNLGKRRLPTSLAISASQAVKPEYVMRIKPFFAIAAAISLGAPMLGGCAATIPPVEVTRFHTGAGVTAGDIALLPVDGVDAQSLEFRTYAAAVAQQLSRLGYKEVNAATTPYVAELEIARGVRDEPNRRSPVTIGVGGGTFGRNVGLSVGTAIGLGDSGPKQTIITKLSVRMKNRADGKPFWEGRAETAARANAPAAQPGLAAQKLADALFRGFPGKSGETVVVP